MLRGRVVVLLPGPREGHPWCLPGVSLEPVLKKGFWFKIMAELKFQPTDARRNALGVNTAGYCSRWEKSCKRLFDNLIDSDVQLAGFVEEVVSFRGTQYFRCNGPGLLNYTIDQHLGENIGTLSGEIGFVG